MKRLCVFVLIASLFVAASAQQMQFAASGPKAVVFLTDSDIHVGSDVSDYHWLNNSIKAMNAIPSATYPSGRKVGIPRGLFALGDLTQNSWVSQADTFYAYFDTGGLLDWPLYETTGNHDIQHPHYMEDSVLANHGGVDYYVVDLGLVVVIINGWFPDTTVSTWLAGLLDSTYNTRPVILMQHIGFTANAIGQGYYTTAESLALYNAVAGHTNILGLIHGHSHGSKHYLWEGMDMYEAAANKLTYQDAFFVVRVTEHEMYIGEYHYTVNADTVWDGTGTWYNTYEKNF